MRGHRHADRGFAVLTLAIVGLVMSAFLTAPLLGLVSLGILTQSGAGSPLINGAALAAEHALWRIASDPAFLDSMTGTPPTASYTLDLPLGEASITVSATSPVADESLRATLTIDPASILPNTPTTVTFRLTVINDDDEAHEISRLEADPRTFTPLYVTGSTTGLTTNDPSYVAGRWRWQLLPYATVSGFGGEAFITWRMVVDEGEGGYWTRGSARIDDFGTISAPLTSNVRVAEIRDVEIQTVVTPSVLSAGAEQTFNFTITILNSGLVPLTVDWIKHFSPRELDYQNGSTSGLTSADPQIRHDVINDRWVHTWDVDPTPLLPAVPVTLSFRTQATLLPGTYYSTGAVKVAEDLGAVGQESTASTGDTAPISARRAYRVTVVLNGETVDVEALLASTGIEILSWLES